MPSLIFSFIPSTFLICNRTGVKQYPISHNKYLSLVYTEWLFAGTTSSKQYDISLMMCLMRNVGSLSRPTNGFDQLPLPTFISNIDDLARIKFYRNKLAHSDSDKLPTTEFQGIWQDLVGVSWQMLNSNLLYIKGNS